MGALLDLLNPSRQNEKQKIGFFLTFAILVALVVLHNPIHGYETTTWTSTPVDHECLAALYDDRQEIHRNPDILDRVDQILNAPAEAELQKQRMKCGGILVESPLPITDWQSNEPIVAWFGYLLNFLFAALATFVVGMMWLYLSKASNGTSTTREADAE